MTKTRGLFIAGNWKMNLGIQETQAYFAELKKDLVLFEDNRGGEELDLR